MLREAATGGISCCVAVGLGGLFNKDPGILIVIGIHERHCTGIGNLSRSEKSMAAQATSDGKDKGEMPGFVRPNPEPG